jgi:hypothetical protein
MSTLTRRSEGHDGWHIYFGDVRIGHIGKRSGVPNHVEQWGWTIGFDPGLSTRLGGDTASFEEARAQFETAWSRILPSVTEDQFESWRRSRDFTAWKYRMWKEGYLLPTQISDGRGHCFCGAAITNADIEPHIQAAHRGIGA